MRYRVICIALLSLGASGAAFGVQIQEAPRDAKAPAGMPPRIIDGMVSTAEIADWRAAELKKKLLTDRKVMGCFGLTPKNGESAFNASAKTCKEKTVKDMGAQVKPPEQVEKASGAFITCLRDTILKTQGVAPEKFFACTQRK